MKNVVRMSTVVCLTLLNSASADTVKIGMNYPQTGPYAAVGADQMRATELAVEEINAAGGILGKQIEILARDSQSKQDVTIENVTEMIENNQVKMVFGGASSGVAIAAAGVCQEKGVPFFGTLTYSTATTGAKGHRHTFRECYDSRMAAKALSAYLQKSYPNRKFFYITANYTWSHTTEESIRIFTKTTDDKAHRRIVTPFPGATEADFKKALGIAKLVKPDVLVLVLFGDDMVNCVRQATAMGMKNQLQIVVPNLSLEMAESGGGRVMEGVVGTLPWCWQVPVKYHYARGQKFADDFSARFNRYPSTSGASAYTILYQYKDAVERAGSFDAPAVIKALEGHRYTFLKDEQQWRDFDHQSVQSVYLVRCKPEAEVTRDKFQLDYFEILDQVSGGDAVCTREEWNAARTKAGKPTHLEPLPGEAANP